MEERAAASRGANTGKHRVCLGNKSNSEKKIMIVSRGAGDVCSSPHSDPSCRLTFSWSIKPAIPELIHFYEENATSSSDLYEGTVKIEWGDRHENALWYQHKGRTREHPKCQLRFDFNPLSHKKSLKIFEEASEWHDEQGVRNLIPFSNSLLQLGNQSLFSADNFLWCQFNLSCGRWEGSPLQPSGRAERLGTITPCKSKPMLRLRLPIHLSVSIVFGS